MDASRKQRTTEKTVQKIPDSRFADKTVYDKAGQVSGC